MEQYDLSQLVTGWLEQNRALLPLNSLHWEPLFTPPADNGQHAARHRLGKYDAVVLHADFFYKAISKIP